MNANVGLYLLQPSGYYKLGKMNALVISFWNLHYETKCSFDTCPKKQLNSVSSTYRCMWSDRPCPCGVPAGEGPSCPDRIREIAVPQPATTLRPLTAASACSACRASQPHLSALLHAVGGQDAHRDADPRHAVIRELHQLALCIGTVNASGPQSETDRDQIGRRQSLQRLLQIQTECHKYNLKSLKKSAVPCISSVWWESHQSCFQGNNMLICLYT